MCTVGGEEDDLNVLMPEKEREECKNCVKCGEPGCVITRIQDSFCKACFQVFVVHKFRAAIGKSKLIRDGQQVLVAYSGGQNSSALLHLIEDGLSKRAHKKLRFTPVLLHVDQSGVPGLSGDDKHPCVERVTKVMAATGYPAYTTALEMALSVNSLGAGKEAGDNSPLYWNPPEHKEQCSSERVESLRERLKAVVNGLASVSAREDFIGNLRHQLLACIARQMGFDKVLTADCSTRLAVRILSDMAQGRGSQVAFNTNFCDSRQDVLFLRPVRDLSSKELAMYNHLFEVDTAVALSLSTKGAAAVSVERLTESFVLGLQTGYQSTVSNIVRTSEKLGLPDFGKGSRCWFCQSLLDTFTGDTSALKAVEVSLQLSHGKVAGGDGSRSKGQGDGSRSCNESEASSKECCGEGDGSCQTRVAHSLTADEVSTGLCYGCRLALRGYKGNFEELPNFLTQKALSDTKRQKLREEIADFLLDEEEDADP